MISISLKFPDLAGKLERHQKEIDLFIAATMQTNRGMLFDAEGAANGHKKWAPLKSRDGMILSKTGKLRQSLAPSGASGRPGTDGIVRFTGNKITIGTRVAYAKMMNYGTAGLPGGVLVPKNSKVLRFKMYGVVTFATKVRIPARNFNTWNTQDKLEMSVALKNKIVEILNR